MDIAFSSRRMATVGAASVQPECVEDSTPKASFPYAGSILLNDDAASGGGVFFFFFSFSSECPRQVYVPDEAVFPLLTIFVNKPRLACTRSAISMSAFYRRAIDGDIIILTPG